MAEQRAAGIGVEPERAGMILRLGGNTGGDGCFFSKYWQIAVESASVKPPSCSTGMRPVGLSVLQLGGGLSGITGITTSNR